MHACTVLLKSCKNSTVETMIPNIMKLVVIYTFIQNYSSTCNLHCQPHRFSYFTDEFIVQSFLSLLHGSLLIRNQISSECCVSFSTINSICRTFDQTNPHGLILFQLHKNCFTQLIMALVVSVQLGINFTIFHQLNVGFVTILLQKRETDLINTINRCSELSSAGIVTISDV
jgi:hypothetical protein